MKGWRVAILFYQNTLLTGNIPAALTAASSNMGAKIWLKRHLEESNNHINYFLHRWKNVKCMWQSLYINATAV